MSLVTALLIGMLVSDIVMVSGLVFYIYKLYKDVEYLKKKMVKVESLIDREKRG